MSDRESSPFVTKPSARSFWPWVPAMLLGSMLIGLGTMAFVAIDDPHFALEPNYYDKAVHWDQSQAEASASRALGVRLELQPLAVSAGGQVELVLVLEDRASLPLAGAEVRLEAFPNAYAGQIERLQLRETAPGVYTGKLGHGVPGLWELRFTIEPGPGSASYRQVLRRDVSKAGAA
jgi:hypothetical protein